MIFDDLIVTVEEIKKKHDFSDMSSILISTLAILCRYGVKKKEVLRAIEEAEELDDRNVFVEDSPEDVLDTVKHWLSK